MIMLINWILNPVKISSAPDLNTLTRDLKYIIFI